MGFPAPAIKHFRFTWGPPCLARALKTRDPRHVTRAPRKHRRREGPPEVSELVSALKKPGAECRILRRPDAPQRTYESWYVLEEPVAATLVVGRSTDANVSLRYSKGPEQCARFCIPAASVPEAERTTRIIKVTETLETGADQYVTKTITAMPEAALKALERGEVIVDHVLTRLNRACARGLKCKAKRLWKAVGGENAIFIHII